MIIWGVNGPQLFTPDKGHVSQTAGQEGKVEGLCVCVCVCVYVLCVCVLCVCVCTVCVCTACVRMYCLQ